MMAPLKKHLTVDATREMVDAIGGLTAVGSIFGIAPSSVWAWYHKTGMPVYRLLALKNTEYKRLPSVKTALKEL